MGKVVSRSGGTLLFAGAMFSAGLLFAQSDMPPSGADAPSTTVVPVNTAATPVKAAPAPINTATPKLDIPRWQRDKAERDYLHGAKMLAAGDFKSAEQSFAQAVTLNPEGMGYVQALALAQEHRITGLLQQAAAARPTHPEHAERLMAEARGIDANNPRVRQHDPMAMDVDASDIRLPDVAALGTPITLAPAAGQRSFHLYGDLKTVAPLVASAYGLKAVYDNDIRERDAFHYDLDRVDGATALQALEMLSHTFAVPLDAKTMLLATNNRANHERFDRFAEETIPLPGFTNEQINETANMLRNVFELKHVAVSVQMGSLSLRAPQDTVEAVNTVLSDLMDSRSEVMLDLKLYTVDTDKVRNLGVQLPSSIGAFSVASEAQSIISQNQSLVDQLIASGVLPANASQVDIAAYLVLVAGLGSSSLLKNSFLLFGGGLTTGGVSVGSIPTLNLALNQSDARALDDVQLRISDRGSSTFKSGTRYPIQTSLYSDVASSSTSALSGITVSGVSLASLLSQYTGTSSNSSLANQVIPQFQYEDLGLTLKAEPRVQRGGMIGMHLEIKITALAGAALNGIPILANRSFSSDLMMLDGQTALMASNVTRNETMAVTGVPGLSELPGFQGATNKYSDKSTSNLVLLITPHVIRQAHTQPKGPYVPVVVRQEPD